MATGRIAKICICETKDGRSAICYRVVTRRLGLKGQADAHLRDVCHYAAAC